VGATVVVCRKCKGHKCLTDFLLTKTEAAVQGVRCQKICSGPIAGVAVAGRMEWFERVDKAKAMVGVAQLATKPGSAKVPKALRKERVGKHSGRPVR
jgi:hypothetical protein